MTNILVVDDNPELVQEVLPVYGFDMAIALDGISALEILDKSNKKFDLILLDILMPRMNGWELLKMIRENSYYKRIPIIILTALNNEIDLVSSLKVGADDYIAKPFNIPILMARIEALLRRVAWFEMDNKAACLENEHCHTGILTSREKEIINHLTEGRSNKDIAEKLFISELTVKTHLKNIFKKLNVSNRTQAILTAIEKGLIEKEHV